MGQQGTKYMPQDVRDGKENNNCWLIWCLERLFCGKGELEMLEPFAERSLSQKAVFEEAATAQDHGNGKVQTSDDGWGRPHSTPLFLLS